VTALGLLRLMAALVALFALPASAAEAHWVAQPDVPGARQEVSYVQLGGNFYLAGGGTAHQVFVPQTGQWSNVAPLPASIDHIQGVAVGGKIYYIGGLSNWPSPHVSTVYIYDPATNQFSQGASMGARGRGAGGVAVHDGKIYYAGGLHNGTAVNWLDVYDPETDDWTPLPNMPTARDHFHAAVLDGKLWAIGGRNVHNGSTTTANEAYSFASGTWSTNHAPLPTPRGGFSVATQGDEVFVIGGEDATKAHGTVEAYNVKTNTWRTIATPMPVPRHGIQAAKCNGGFYVAAGGTAPGYNPSTAHHAFFPGGSARPCGSVVAFGKSALSGESSNFPTSMQFGPDGRLYVAQQNGVIFAYEVERDATNTYRVTSTEEIDDIWQMPNRDDDGTLADPSVNQLGRLVTGIVVTGTLFQPVIYVGSSDPRIGGGEGLNQNDLNLDTNSGVISRLTKTQSGWAKVDLVRGLPRSEENHTVNGLALSADGNTLYAAQGGNTNKGAPSNGFAGLPEYALSAAILSIDLQAIGNTTYDLPTLNDPDRAGSPDANDPFGGNDGKNQARLVPGGPVQIFAPGFRNPYDIVFTASGQMFSIDNGGNAGWGDIPLPDGAGGTCTNAIREPGSSDRDALHRIIGQGYYGGHPNPTRANKSNTFGGQTPIDGAANPVECDYRAPGDANGNGNESGALTTFGSSTNGLAEYTATNFGGAMQGDLVTAGLDLNNIYRIQLTSNTKATVSTLAANAGGGGGPLDVIAQGDDDRFPGTIWFADIYNGGIYVLEPADYGGGSAACNLSVPDADGDGFSNGDELANGTNPCSAADAPPDADGDHVSDRTDPDDDNDALADTADAFARDASNGLSTALPVNLEWENNSAPGGLLNLGFTGLMQTAGVDYLDQFDRTNMTTGGAAGIVTVDEVPAGDAYTNINSQQYGFQLGFHARLAVGPFIVHTRVMAPFAGLTPVNYQSMGLFVGTGNQDNYVKVTTAHVGQTLVESLSEFNGLRDEGYTEPLTMPGPSAVDLYLRVDPIAGKVQPSFTSTTGGVTSPRRNVGTALTVPSSWFTDPQKGLAAGIISTSNGGGGPFPASWDFLKITAENPPPPPPPPPPPSPADGDTNPRPPAPQPGGGQEISYTLTPRRLARALRRGFAVRLTCPAACTVSGRLDASRKVARRYRLGQQATRVARGSASRPDAGEKTLVLRFTSTAKRRLLRARRVDLTLRLTLEQGGQRRSERRTVRLSR
jgi:Kelch motif protein/thrombospondin type 3 repeat protein